MIIAFQSSTPYSSTGLRVCDIGRIAPTPTFQHFSWSLPCYSWIRTPRVTAAHHGKDPPARRLFLLIVRYRFLSSSIRGEIKISDIIIGLRSPPDASFRIREEIPDAILGEYKRILDDFAGGRIELADSVHILGRVPNAIAVID